MCRRQTCRIDTEKMHTAAGQATQRDIFRSSPVVAWEHHADDHLQIANEHVRAGLVANFPKSPARPRKQHISGQQWDAIRQRRHARRVCFRGSHSMVFRCLEGRGVRSHTCCQTSAKVGFFVLARLGKVIHQLTTTIKKLESRDSAEHVRIAFQESRLKGCAELARLLRGVRKCGRRYKKPLQ